VFATLQALQAALAANDESAITATAGALHAAASHVNTQLSYYGVLQQRISTAVDLAEKYQVQATVALSEQRDTDLPAAVLELTQIRTAQEAAFGAQAKLQQKSLFDYLS
jgi:flagellar hook-associated protein 3 FlgL